MPRTSGVTPYWVRRESGGRSAVNTGRFTMSLTLSGAGTPTQHGAGGLLMSLTLAGSGAPHVAGTGALVMSMTLAAPTKGLVSQSGAGALAMSLTLSGTGSVVTPTTQPARPVIVLVRRRKR